MSIYIRAVRGSELEGLVPALVALLRDAVDSGASLGFLVPLADDVAREYWRSLRGDLDAGRRVLLIAYSADRVVGAGQLVLPAWPNAQHRAEIQKLFVDSALRGRGVGRSLMAALHDAARRRGRDLILLSAKHGDASERFYRAYGYQEVGVTPGYFVGSDGQRHDNVSLYQHLAP
jgi:acetyltransferase